MMHLRPTSDASLIATLNRPIHEHHIELVPTFFAAYDHALIEEAFSKMMAQDTYHFFTAEVDDEIIGYVCFEERVSEANAFRHAVRTLYVHQISINPDVKRHGYGRLIMEHVERFAVDHKFSSIELDYWSVNEEASTFYERVGFQAKRQIVIKHL